LLLRDQHEAVVALQFLRTRYETGLVSAAGRSVGGYPTPGRDA
jgi:hypothetical protein